MNQNAENINRIVKDINANKTKISNPNMLDSLGLHKTQVGIHKDDGKHKYGSSPKLVSVVKQYIQKACRKPLEPDPLKQSMDLLHVKSEYDIYQNPLIADYASKLGVNLEDELHENFKPLGPIDNSWLSNHNIEAVLDQMKIRYPNFFYYECQMMDFMDVGGSLLQLATTPDQFTVIGCVLNTDKTGNRGKHWVCLLVDRRTNNSTIEYFNSSGQPPVKKLVEFIEKCKKQMGITTYVVVSDIEHQKSNSECGMYSLFYIWCRLLGISWKYFRDNRVEDKIVFEFRKYVFLI